MNYAKIAAAKRTDTPAYGQPVSGYGKRIPTRYMIKLEGSDVWRRVYCVIYGNAGSLYVGSWNEMLWINDWELEEALAR